MRMHLTGGIGAGKSAVAALLAELGWLRVDADRIGHEVLLSTGDAFERVSKRWPETVVNGEIDRPRLAAVVFNDPNELAALEAITHPAIGRTIREAAADADLVVVEAALLDVGFKDETWTTVVVDAPDDVRISRLRSRGMAREDVEKRMSAQPDREEYLASADFVVDNSGDESELAVAVDSLHVMFVDS